MHHWPIAAQATPNCLPWVGYEGSSDEVLSTQCNESCKIEAKIGCIEGSQNINKLLSEDRMGQSTYELNLV